MDIVRNDFEVASAAIDEAAGVYGAVIATGVPMRNGNVIVPAGGQFDNYLRNPVVPWAHQYSAPPVAKCLGLEPCEFTITARWQFAPRGVSARADEIHDLWAGGFLNAVSIGIVPLEWEELPGGEERWFPPLRFTAWEMAEFSIVTVPNNPEALRTSEAEAWGLSPVQRAMGALRFARNVGKRLESLKEGYDGRTRASI